MPKHSLATGKEIHIAHKWEFDDATERLSYDAFSEGDLYKIALQKDDYSLWMVTDLSTPTWHNIATVASVDGDNVTLNTTNFNSILSATEDNAQKALDKIDDNAVNIDGTNAMTGSLDMGGNAIGNITNLEFDSVAEVDEPAYEEGLVFYSNRTKSLIQYTDSSDVNLNIGQDNFVKGYNDTGADISKGKVVYPSSATGDVVEISLAKADSLDTSRPVGITAERIVSGEQGWVITFGSVIGIDTSSYTVGDTLYVSASTAGNLTNTKPSSPNRAVRVGVVTRVSETDGKILVDTDVENDIFTTNSILFANGNGELIEDNINLYYNPTSDTLFAKNIQANGTLSLDNGTTTISSTELNYIDGLDQSLSTSDNPTFAGINSNGLLEISQQTDSEGIEIYGYDDVASHYLRAYITNLGYGKFLSSNVMEFTTINSSNMRFYSSADINMQIGASSYFRIYDDSFSQLLRISYSGSVILSGLLLTSDNNINIGTGYISGDGTNEGLSFDSNNNAYLSGKLHLDGNVNAELGYDGNCFTAKSQNDVRCIDLTENIITSDTTVANTTTETTIYTESISADELHTGQHIQTRFVGYYSTGNATNTFTLRYKIGGTTVATLVSSAANATNNPVFVEFYSTVRSEGASGTIISGADGTFGTAKKTSIETSPDTIDTTVAETITVTIQWSAADVDNNVTINQGLTMYKG